MTKEKNALELRRKHRQLKEEFRKLLERSSKGMQGDMTEAQYESLMAKTIQASKLLDAFEKEHGHA